MFVMTRPSLTDPAALIATWFGAGYLPKAPGTWGSLAALPFAALLLWAGGPVALAAAAFVLFPLGVWAAARFCAGTGAADAGEVVVDEVVGQWLALVPLVNFSGANFDFLWFVVGFALFRLFDVWKPWPVAMLDRSVKGGLGVMVDDVAAGLLAAAVLWGLLNVSA